MRGSCARSGWSVNCRLTLAGCLAVLISAGARAQVQNAPQGAESEAPKLQEIVVTAQRRAENLQAVPVSAQVISAQVLEQQNLNALTTLTQTVPSVHVGTSGRANELYIRGIGSGINQSFDQSVGMFIDDIYHGRSRISSATFLDLDRVEILKGPQSTFFGNNAIAGAFNIVTKRPGHEFDALARAIYGEDRQYAAEGAVGGPINDVFGVRLAAMANGMDGWLKNVTTGDHFPHDNNIAARLSFVFEPGQSFDATLKVEGGRNRNTGTWPRQLVNCPPPAPFPAPAGFCKMALSQGLPTGIDSNHNAESSGGGIKLDTLEDVLTLNYRAGGHTLTSVSGFYNYHYRLNFDADELPATLLHIQIPEDYHQFSEELRVASPTEQRIEYLAGLYFQTDRLEFTQGTNYSFLSPRIASAAPLAKLVPYLPLGQLIAYSQPEKSYSAFGSITFNVTDRLKLSGGLRGSWVDKDYGWNLRYGTATQSFGGITPLPAAVAPTANAVGLGPAGTLSGSRHDSAWLPSARVQYQLLAQTMAYFSYAKGFKAGGFNGADTTGIPANLPYNPEHVNAYEAGIKSELFADRLLVNAAVFRSDYDDLQVSTSVVNSAGALVSLVRNAASSRSQGVELEGRWAAARSFDLSATVTYLDARYRSYPNVSVTSLQQLQGLKVQDLSGKPTDYAPDWSGSVSAILKGTLAHRYGLSAELSTYFSSGYYLSSTDDIYASQSAYARLDARLTLTSPDDRWALDLIGKNLTDRDILAYANIVPNSLGSYVQQKEQPRNVAAQVRCRW